MASILHGRFFRIIFTIFSLIIIAVIAKNIYIKQVQIKALAKQNEQLDKQIAQMSNKIVEIKRNINIAEADPHIIEHRAKNDLMMVDKNESIIIFHDDSK